MLIVKTIKQGNTIVVTVPETLGVEPGKEYVVMKGEKGAFTYIPKLEDIFEKAEKENLNLRPEKNVWANDDEAVGREF